MKGQRGGKEAEGARRLVKSLTCSVTNWPGGTGSRTGYEWHSSTVCYTQEGMCWEGG
jgi:hypothetical protein